MTRGLLLILLMLIATLSFSQTSYPKKIVINKDTLVAITPIQLIEINKRLFELEDLKEYNCSLEELSEQVKTSLDRQIKLNRELYKRNTQLLSDYSDALKLNETNDKLITYLNKEIKVQKRKKTASFFAGTITGIAITSTILILK